MVNAKPQPLYPSESNPVPIIQEAGWAPGPVWMGVENLSFTRIRSPDCIIQKLSKIVLLLM
jgi:hypothetical protein